MKHILVSENMVLSGQGRNAYLSPREESVIMRKVGII